MTAAEAPNRSCKDWRAKYLLHRRVPAERSESYNIKVTNRSQQLVDRGTFVNNSQMMSCQQAAKYRYGSITWPLDTRSMQYLNYQHRIQYEVNDNERSALPGLNKFENYSLLYFCLGSV